MNRIYLDYAAATPIDPRVKAEMDRVAETAFANPGGLHSEAAAAKDLLEKARGDAARMLGAYPDEIVFTSGGTEANNLAILGAIQSFEKQGIPRDSLHVITSQIEHSSVRQPMQYLEKQGVAMSWVGVEENGLINLKELKETLSDRTALVSIIHANNEIGSIQSIADIAKAVRMHHKRSVERKGSLGKNAENDGKNKEPQPPNVRPLVHTDAAQSPLYTDLDLGRMGVDLATVDSSKMYGPRGIGILYVRRGTPLGPLFYGGSQERKLRPGTENPILAAGMAAALRIAAEERAEETVRLSKLRDRLLEGIKEIAPEAVVNGGMDHRLANNLNLSFPGVDTEFLIIALDELGVACSTKSACLENDEVGSYVVRALSGDGARAKSTLRLSLGRFTTEKEVETVLQKMRQAVRTSRSGLAY
jgi:cysteine desulfurase